MEFTLKLKDIVTINNIGRGYCLPDSFLHAFNDKNCKSANEKSGSIVSEMNLLHGVGTIINFLKRDRSDGKLPMRVSHYRQMQIVESHRGHQSFTVSLKQRILFLKN